MSTVVLLNFCVYEDSPTLPPSAKPQESPYDPINPPINLLDVFQVEGNDPAELILPSSSSEVEKTLLGSGRGGF